MTSRYDLIGRMRGKCELPERPACIGHSAIGTKVFGRRQAVKISKARAAVLQAIAGMTRNKVAIQQKSCYVYRCALVGFSSVTIILPVFAPCIE